MRLVPVGPSAVLVELDDAAAAADLAAWVRRDELDVAVEEVVPAARTVLLDGIEPGLRDLDALERVLAGWTPGRMAGRGPLVEVPVVYDGPDLDEVGRLWGVPGREVGRLHASVEYVASFCGFAPGFSYLAGLPEERGVPRHDSPRAKVPAGSVALAGTWCGIYPTASPGGWQLIGTTDASLWDAGRDEPALLPPGTRVRFVER